MVFYKLLLFVSHHQRLANSFISIESHLPRIQREGAHMDVFVLIGFVLYLNLRLFEPVFPLFLRDLRNRSQADHAVFMRKHTWCVDLLLELKRVREFPTGGPQTLEFRTLDRRKAIVQRVVPP